MGYGSHTIKGLKMDKKERRKMVDVRDGPAELWIKVLSLVALVTLPLISVIGNSLITGQKEMNHELSKISGIMQTIESRVSRNEMDIKDNRSSIKLLNNKATFASTGD